jgi:hypothetical protein
MSGLRTAGWPKRKSVFQERGIFRGSREGVSQKMPITGPGRAFTRVSGVSEAEKEAFLLHSFLAVPAGNLP